MKTADKFFSVLSDGQPSVKSLETVCAIINKGCNNSTKTLILKGQTWDKNAQTWGQ